MGAVVALVAVLMVLLSGLSVGLVNDGASGLKQLPVTSLAFQEDVKTDSAFTRSVVDRSAVEVWAEQANVADAAPLGLSLVNARSTEGVDIDLALVGVEPDSFLAPDAAEGTGVQDPDGIVVSPTAIDAGLRLATPWCSSRPAPNCGSWGC